MTKSNFRNMPGRSAPAPAVREPDVGAGRRAAATFAASLAFEQVERRYGETLALAQVDLAVAPGEIVSLLGPSGCGKTTLLRIAAGIERPTAGRVLIDGQEVAGPGRFVPPEKRNVGLMFQDFALFPHLSILRNVAFGLSKLSRAEAEREARAMLTRVGLADYADAFPHTLSGGQQQRVALARAIVPRPAVMLMDEPFSGLDVQLREAMQEETLALLRETRATTMLVTHHPEEAMRMSDRIAVMRAGRIVQVGRAEELYAHPADLFVARLFSEINEFEYRAMHGAIFTPFGQINAAGVADGARVVVCIRERSIRLAEPGCGLKGRVRDVKFLGDTVLIEVSVEGFDQPLRVRGGDGRQPFRGTEVGVLIDPEHALVFPGSHGVA